MHIWRPQHFGFFWLPPRLVKYRITQPSSLFYASWQNVSVMRIIHIVSQFRRGLEKMANFRQKIVISPLLLHLRRWSRKKPVTTVQSKTISIDSILSMPTGLQHFLGWSFCLNRNLLNKNWGCDVKYWHQKRSLLPGIPLPSTVDVLCVCYLRLLRRRGHVAGSHLPVHRVGLEVAVEAAHQGAVLLLEPPDLGPGNWREILN